jgi:hypothetical protein
LVIVVGPNLLVNSHPLLSLLVPLLHYNASHVEISYERLAVSIACLLSFSRYGFSFSSRSCNAFKVVLRVQFFEIDQKSEMPYNWLVKATFYA